MTIRKFINIAKKFPKRRKQIKTVFIYFLECIALIKKKDKIAKTEFVKKKITFYDFEIMEILEIKFVYQDTSKEDEMRLENRIKKYEWAWDFKNVTAALLLLIILAAYAYLNLYAFYCEYLPALAFRDAKFDTAVNHAMFTTFVEINFLIFPTLANKNYWLVELLTSFCSRFFLLF